MPTYEYVCRSCGEQLEVVQSFKDDALTICPNCGGDLKKIFGNIGIVFKGSGFYKTDSRSTTTAAKSATNGSAASSSGDKSETKQDTPQKSDSTTSATPAPSTSSSTSSAAAAS
jgi:putative FmdB family regulatory protein